LEQIKDKKYYEKYLLENVGDDKVKEKNINKKTIYIIGVGFNGKKREISDWIVEEI